MGNAALLGLKEELNMETGTKYNTALAIFFVPYVIFEIPSNILLKKMKPHVWCMYSRHIHGLLEADKLLSIAMHVHVWPCHGLSRVSFELGRIDDRAMVSGDV